MFADSRDGDFGRDVLGLGLEDPAAVSGVVLLGVDLEQLVVQPHLDEVLRVFAVGGQAAYQLPYSKMALILAFSCSAASARFMASRSIARSYR